MFVQDEIRLSLQTVDNKVVLKTSCCRCPSSVFASHKPVQIWFATQCDHISPSFRCKMFKTTCYIVPVYNLISKILLFSLQRLLFECIISACKDTPDMVDNLLEHGGPALVLNQKPEMIEMRNSSYVPGMPTQVNEILCCLH